MQEKLFRETILFTVNSIRDQLPPTCLYQNENQSILDNSMNLLIYDIIMGLTAKNKSLID